MPTEDFVIRLAQEFGDTGGGSRENEQAASLCAGRSESDYAFQLVSATNKIFRLDAT